MIKSFFMVHVRYINPVKDHPGRIKNIDRDFANNLNYDDIKFSVQEKDFSKMNYKIIFVLMFWL